MKQIIMNTTQHIFDFELSSSASLLSRLSSLRDAFNAFSICSCSINSLSRIIMSSMSSFYALKALESKSVPYMFCGCWSYSTLPSESCGKPTSPVYAPAFCYQLFAALISSSRLILPIVGVVPGTSDSSD